MTSQLRAEQLAEKRRFWEQQIQQWKDSGLTQMEFCRLRSLKTHQFTYWKKRFHRTQVPVSLIELQLGSPLQSQTCFSIGCPAPSARTFPNAERQLVHSGINAPYFPDHLTVEIRSIFNIAHQLLLSDVET